MNRKNKQLQLKLQIKNSDKFCQGFYFMKFLPVFFLFLFLSFANVSFAENTYTFSTEPQSIGVGEMSGKINVQSGSPVTETTYLTFTSSSATGQFLNSSGNPLTSAYISNGDSNRAVYYKDTTSGDFVITAEILSKEKVHITSITQHIFVGTSGTGNANTTGTNTSTTTQTQTENSTTNNTSSSSNSSAHSSPSPLSNIENKMEFEISAGRDRLTSVGSSIVFQAVPTKLQNISANNITYSWSFGDGTFIQGNNISHAYKFPGEYAVVVNASYSDKQAVSRIVVKVANPKIILTRVDGGVEISNNSGVEINLENWNLIGPTKTFTFPKDTLLPNGKKVVFADDVTGINSGSMRLENPLNRKYAEIAEVAISEPLVLGVSTSTNNIADEIVKVTKSLALLSSQINEGKGLEVENTSNTFVVAEPRLEQKIIPEATATDSQLDNTATVFEAPASQSFVNTIFAWPIAGFNFIRSLFVER